MKTKLFFDYTSAPHTKNEDFWITVMLDTQGQPINANEGNIVVDSRFTIKDINDADSNVTFWIERPIQDKNIVSFSGIIPGGFVSNKGKVFSLLVHSNEIGNETISARDIKVLQNDGKGSVLENMVVPANIQITEGQVKTTAEIIDKELPESFTPLVSTDPALFGGNNFVVFSTQDKLSGIKEYQVKEGFWGTYTAAQSPYELHYQRLDRTIYIKAVDKQGNERIETVGAQHISITEGIVLGILLCVGVVLLVKKIWKRTSIPSQLQ